MRSEGFDQDFAAYFRAPHIRRLRYATAALGALPLATIVVPSLSYLLMPLFLLGLFGMSIVWLVVGIRDRTALPADVSRDARIARTTVIVCAVVMLVAFALIAVMAYIGWSDMQPVGPV